MNAPQQPRHAYAPGTYVGPAQHFPPAAPVAAPTAKTSKPRRWPWVAGIFAAFLFGISVGNAGDSTPPPAAVASAPDPTPLAVAPAYEPEPVETLAPAAPAGPATSFGDGMYEVGTDVVAGRYKTTGSDGSGLIDSCYWERAKNDSGEFSAIISNDNISGPGSITIKDGEFVKSNGGCVWTKQ